MSKKKTLLIIGLVVVLLIVIAFAVKSMFLPKVSFTHNGSIAFDDTVHTTIRRSKVLKLSMEIEKHIKETYGYTVKVKNIEINGSSASLSAKTGATPATIGSMVKVYFEENEYIEYISNVEMFSLEVDDIPHMNIQLKNN